MKDSSKTKQSLIAEISILKKKIQELEQRSSEKIREESERRARQLTVLHETSVELTSELNLEALLHSIAQRALNLIGGKSCNCYIYKPELDLIERVAVAGEEIVLGGKMRRRGDGAVGQVWATGAPLLINDYNTWPGRKRDYDNFPSRAMVSVPVRWSEQFLGVLNILAYTPHRYTQADMDMLELFAAQAAIAIRNARLHDQMKKELAEQERTEEALRSSEEEARRLAQENEVIAEIGRIISSSLDIGEVYERFAEEVHKLTPIDRITINIINHKDNTVTNAYVSGTELPHRKKGNIYPLAFTITDEVRRTRAGLLVNEENYRDYFDKFPGLALSLQAGFRSMMAIPLISKDEVIGVLQFRSTELNTYSDKDMKLAERVASQIAGAIANAQLFLERKQAEDALRESEKAARRLAQENELIAEIGRIISSTLNIEEVYERFAEKVREVIPFDRIAVNSVSMKDYARTIRYVKGDSFSGNGVGEVISLAGTRIEQVVRTKSSLLINNMNKEDMMKFPSVSSLQLGVQSMMVIPLISKDEVIGTLGIHSVMADAYSEKDLRLAERVGNQIAGAVANAQFFLERNRAVEALQKSEETAKKLAQENDFVAEIGRIISSSLDIDEVYERFAEKVRAVIPFDNLSINIVNTKDNTRTIRYNSGTYVKGRKIGDVVPLGGSITEKIVRTRSGALINLKDKEELLRQYPGILHTIKAGFQSMMVIPLISKDEAIGAFLFRSLKPDAYTEGDMRLAERVGSQIAGAVANAQLFLERKQAEEALAESEAKYYDLYENAPDMYYSVDLATGAIKECNETLLQKTGYSKEELIGSSIFELYDPGSAGDAKKSFQQFPATGEVRDAERRVKCKDGRIIHVSLNVSAVSDKDGNITHSRSIWRDITKRKEQEEMIRALSITDQLTGLYNRRGFTPLAEQQLRVAERTKNGLLLLYADMDGLKQINDRLGHRSGDEAIVEASNVLKEVFRKTDIIARMGGDEFAVLASEASLEYSDIIKNRLQDQLAVQNARTVRDYNLSLSIGMVYYDPSTPSSLDELISRADSLMYEQKRRKKPVESQG